MKEYKSFKDFKNFLDDYWVYLNPEFISWYINKSDILEKYWGLWRPYIIYSVVLPAIENKNDKDRSIEYISKNPYCRTPDSWTKFPGAGD